MAKIVQGRKRQIVTRSKKVGEEQAVRKQLGSRRRSRRGAFKNTSTWQYIGDAEEEKFELQTAKAGDIVEADHQIFDKKLNACGTRFTFERLEGGFIVGHIDTPTGRMELKKTAGHVAVCHATALEPNSGNIGRRKRRKRPANKVGQQVVKKTRSVNKRKKKRRQDKGVPVDADADADELQQFLFDKNNTNGLGDESSCSDGDKGTLIVQTEKETKEQVLDLTTADDPPAPEQNAVKNSDPPPPPPPAQEQNAVTNTDPPPPTPPAPRQKNDGTKTEPRLKVPKPFTSFAQLAGVKKNMWIQSEGMIAMLQDYLPDVDEIRWTMKRLFVAIVNKHSIPHRISDNAKNLGTSIDWWVANPSGDQTNSGRPRQRWSAQLDLARLLMIMLGDEQARAAYVKSQQLPNRARLDDTTLRSLQVEYWINISRLYNNSDMVIDIDVGNEMANLYLQGIPMSAKYRVDWPAHKLQEMFRKTRSDYEGSTDYDNYKRSGQNSDTYYPDFNHANNPAFVMMHYLLKNVPTGVVMGDLPPNATIDTTVPPDDVSESETEPPDGEQESPAHIEQESPARFTRPRSRRVNSPASSIASSASAGRGRSHSRGRGRGRSSDSTLGSAHATLQLACDQILQSFDSMQEQYRRERQRRRTPSNADDDVISRSNRALKLISTKRQVLAELKLMQDADSDHEDELKLLQTTLRNVTHEIQKYTT